MICSVLIPSRGNPKRLKFSAESFFLMSSPGACEVLVRLDEDDPFLEDYQNLPWSPWFRFVTGPREGGYNDLNMRYTELADIAAGAWVWMMDDDARVTGVDWSEQLSQISLSPRIIFSEWYFLGPSGYHKTGGYFPIVLNGSWKPDRLYQPVDSVLTGLAAQRGWEVNFLSGVEVHHDGRRR